MEYINQIIILFQLGSGRHLLGQNELSLSHMPPIVCHQQTTSRRNNIQYFKRKYMVHKN